MRQERKAGRAVCSPGRNKSNFAVLGLKWRVAWGMAALADAWLFGIEAYWELLCWTNQRDWTHKLED
jgi:hypothetical protein